MQVNFYFEVTVRLDTGNTTTCSVKLASQPLSVFVEQNSGNFQPFFDTRSILNMCGSSFIPSVNVTLMEQEQTRWVNCCKWAEFISTQDQKAIHSFLLWNTKNSKVLSFIVKQTVSHRSTNKTQSNVSTFVFGLYVSSCCLVHVGESQNKSAGETEDERINPRSYQTMLNFYFEKQIS